MSLFEDSTISSFTPEDTEGMGNYSFSSSTTFLGGSLFEPPDVLTIHHGSTESVSVLAPILDIKSPDQRPPDLIDLFDEELGWTKVVRPVPRTPGKKSSAFATKPHRRTPKAKYPICFPYKRDSLLLPSLKKFQAANKREVTIKAKQPSKISTKPKPRSIDDIPFGEFIEILEEHEKSLKNSEADYNAFIAEMHVSHETKNIAHTSPLCLRPTFQLKINEKALDKILPSRDLVPEVVNHFAIDILHIISTILRRPYNFTLTPLQNTVNFKSIASTIKGKHHSYFQKLLNKITNILLTDPATAQMPLRSDPSLEPPEPIEPTHLSWGSTWDDYACMYYNRALSESPHRVVQLFTVEADRDPPAVSSTTVL
jgi:hypothetical protein